MPLPVPAELTAAHWSAASRALLAKALAEFSYEELLEPVPDGTDDGGRYRLDLPDVTYRFRARRGSYGSWFVDPASITRDGSEDVDTLAFVLDARKTLGLGGDTAGHLVRELSATLTADTRLLATAPDAAALADLPYAELEGYQTGHPWIVPNKGRQGFSATDARVFPPEARARVALPWIAVHDSIADYRGVPGLPADRLHAGELDETTRERFTLTLAARGLDPATYHWLPVHPWQWDETTVPLFAADVAHQRIVPLGEGPDDYLAQQSIRTFSNVSHPHRHHVKLPLSVLNTLVWRGLPTERTVAAPAVTAWVLGLRDADPFLAEETRVILLGEVASVTVRHQVLESLAGVPYQYRELLGAIWRQPLPAQLDDGERARTLASLLCVDPAGRSLLAELVARSGRTPREWLRRFLHAMLPPLLHFLYRYGVAFSPHGENAIVVFDAEDTPTRLAVKDFVDDVNLADLSARPDAAPPEWNTLPAQVGEVLLREPPAFLCQFLHSGLFVGHFRYLAELARVHLDVPTEEFWDLVRAEILAYQARFPELSDQFEIFDLLTPRIERLCLNRNRLVLDGYRDRPERPHAAVHGTVPNPLAVHPRAD
ncbi:IucA/IucC family siderophore biosynthesis protein [Actinopolymorpha pittospori]|uniref:Siderophore synthetase component n=1 Tax=Actinopolymorpha pittospori TaxID=648752 RepID=A0A927N5J2_9ACTN|nr:siderophore synthetase component [Actinopolymorpha pittospori]